MKAHHGPCNHWQPAVIIMTEPEIGIVQYCVGIELHAAERS